MRSVIPGNAYGIVGLHGLGLVDTDSVISRTHTTQLLPIWNMLGAPLDGDKVSDVAVDNLLNITEIQQICESVGATNCIFVFRLSTKLLVLLRGQVEAVFLHEGNFSGVTGDPKGWSQLEVALTEGFQVALISDKIEPQTASVPVYCSMIPASILTWELEDEFMSRAKLDSKNVVEQASEVTPEVNVTTKLGDHDSHTVLIERLPFNDSSTSSNETCSAEEIGSVKEVESSLDIDSEPEIKQTYDADHDGNTVMISLPKESLTPAKPAESLTPVNESMVVAACCQSGHPNPPHNISCRVCQNPVGTETKQMVRPNLGHIRISTGAVINLDSDIILGRMPRGVASGGRPAPHLITVASPERLISRTHCEIRVEGWDVQLIDHRSNNGVTLLRSGEVPYPVSPTQPILLREGDIIDIGENVFVTIEELR